MTKGKSVWSRSFFPVLLIFFIDNFGQAIVYPIFTPLFLEPNLLLGEARFTFFHRTFLLGLLNASFPLAQLFGAPLLGYLSDRLGRRRIFMFTITGGIFGYFMTGFGIHLLALPLLWAGRILAGFFAGNLTICLAAIADITKTRQERNRNFGWIGMIAGIGFVLAILTGGSLSNPDLAPFFSPDLPFFITGGLSFVNLWLVIHFFKESHAAAHDRLEITQAIKNLKAPFKIKGIRPVYGAYFLFIICWIASIQFLSAYLLTDYDVSKNVIMLTFIFIGLAWSLANFLLNPILTKIITSEATLFLSLICLSLFLFFTLIPNQPLFLFIIHFFIAATCAGLAWTNGLATLSNRASKFIQGSTLGLNQSVVAIGFIVSPILGGTIAGIDIHKLYIFTACCSLGGALLLFFHLFGIKKS